MNVLLHQVVSDITGTTGMSIIRAIVAGEHDPQTLAALRHPRSRRSATDIAQALQGDYRQEHLFILQQELALYEAYQVQLAACDAQRAVFIELRGHLRNGSACCWFSPP